MSKIQRDISSKHKETAKLILNEQQTKQQALGSLLTHTNLKNMSQNKELRDLAHKTQNIDNIVERYS